MAEAPRNAGLRRLARFLGPEEESWESLLLLALLVGLVSGGSGVALRSAVHALFHALAPLREVPVTAMLLPAVGAVLGVLLVARVFREPSGHGVPEVIRAVCRDGGRMRVRSTVSRWLGSLLNVSAGGSAGLEGPIVFSAAAIGSGVGGLFRVDERRRGVLLACGVAGGIAGIFHAPMTGMVFAMEVVLAEWSAFSIVPVVASAVVGSEVSRLLLGEDESFLHVPFEMGTLDLAACFLLGVVAGFVSTGLTLTIDRFHGLAARLPRLLAPLLFGLVVGAVGLLAPDAIGEGYDLAGRAIRDELGSGLVLALGLIAAKVLTTSLTLGSGAPGGVFAPCLVVGSLLGAAFHRVLVAVVPASWSLASQEGSYALVAMSGLVAGVMQAPLTGIFLVMEVTRGFGVIPPLMIVSVASLLVARRFNRYSLYTRDLARTGDLLRPGTDRRILADVHVGEALDREVTPVHEDLSLAEFVRVVRGSWRGNFPVLKAGSDEYVGMLEMGLVRELLLDPQLARLTLVGTMARDDLPTLAPSATLADALGVFEESGSWVLPVVEAGRFVGLLSKSTLFDHYRRELAVQTSST